MIQRVILNRSFLVSSANAAMNDPFNDDQPLPKSESTISILRRSRLVASFVLFAIVVTIFVGTPIFSTWILQVLFERRYTGLLPWLEQALVSGGIVALITLLWLWLRSHVKWLWARVILGWLCIHLLGSILLLLSNPNANKMPSIRQVFSLGVIPYLFYLAIGFFLGWLIQAVRVQVSWNEDANRSQFGIADLLGLMLAVAIALGEATVTVAGFWFGLGPGTLMLYALLCFLLSLLVTLLLGSVFGPRCKTFRIAFLTAFIVGPLLVGVLLAFVRGSSISVDVLTYTYGFTLAYTLTVLLVFPTLKPMSRTN